MRRWRSLLVVTTGLTVLLLLTTSWMRPIHAEDKPNEPTNESRLSGFPMTVMLTGGTEIQNVTYCSLVNHRGVNLFLLYSSPQEGTMQHYYVNPSHVVAMRCSPRKTTRLGVFGVSKGGSVLCGG